MLHWINTDSPTVKTLVNVVFWTCVVGNLVCISLTLLLVNELARQTALCGA